MNPNLSQTQSSIVNDSQGHQATVTSQPPFDPAASEWLQQQQHQRSMLTQQQHRQRLPQAPLFGDHPQFLTQQQHYRNYDSSMLGRGDFPVDLELERSYLLQAQRRHQRQQPMALQGFRVPATFFGGSDCSDSLSLARLIAASSSSPLAGAHGVNNTVDRLLAAENLLNQRRAKVDEAARAMHLRGSLQGPYMNRAGDDSYKFLTTNSAPQQDPLILPGMFNSASVGVVPSSRTPTLQSSLRPTMDVTCAIGSGKRKADVIDDPPSKKKATSIMTDRRFPLPSKDRARTFSMPLRSYHDLWNGLEESEMQEEAFRRRIYEGIKLRGAKHSLKNP